MEEDLVKGNENKFETASKQYRSCLPFTTRARRPFDIGPKKEEILVHHAEDGIHRSRNRPLA
jgi:hypothetical protein